MFGNRRRRTVSNPLLNGLNANSNATTAAAQAFLKNRASNASLSSAAAATALRSRPTTPTSVADVQTKRTLRRSGSNSSAGSSVAGSLLGRPGTQLQRRGSSGSMSERTFRDPSPSRPSPPIPSAVDAPPVPAIPKYIQQAAPVIPPKSHRRAGSMEAPALRVSSPPPNKASGRGSSLGPGATAPGSQRVAPRMSNTSSMDDPTGLDRPASRGSVNFSLPTSSRPTSPVGLRRLTFPSPQRANLPRITSPTDQNLIYDPNTRRFLPVAEVLAIEQRIFDAANKPVKKKKRIAPNQATGSHFSDGTIGGRPRGTAIQAIEAASNQESKSQDQIAPKHSAAVVPAPAAPPLSNLASENSTANSPRRKKQKNTTLSDSDSDPSVIPQSSDNDSDSSARPNKRNTRTGAFLAKKPSIVREDREREEEEDDTPRRPKAPDDTLKLDTSPAGTRTFSPSPLPRSTAGRGHGRGQALASTTYAQRRQNARSASQPATSPTEPSIAIEGVGLSAKDSVRSNRVQSVSPSRTTHFATTPDSLVVKHQPPLRSVSPRKSALKHSNSPRGTSPVGGAVGPGRSPSEVSNASTVVSDDAIPRKKANRVSFDESNVVVGKAATPLSSDSPVVHSPQTKRSWFSIGRGKKKEGAVVNEDDEVMKPRPALPSFGSVRGRKDHRESAEERPLVKPAEPVEYTPSLPTPPLFTTENSDTINHPMGQSTDHLVGAVIAQDVVSKNEANISKSREPLPPQVTSVEGSGYNSDTDSSIYSLDYKKADAGVAVADSVEPGPEDGPAGTDSAHAHHNPESHNDMATPTAEKINSEDVPEIAVHQATPTLEETESRREWPEMPGAWGTSSSDSGQEDDTLHNAVEHHVTGTTPADVGIAEPLPEYHHSRSPALGEIAFQNAHSVSAIMEETEESDSIYSDAAEDFLDADDDGFMSLDAVVESPVIKVAGRGLAITTAQPESPTLKATEERAYRKSHLSKESSGPDVGEGWNKAQEYWGNLSAEKKRQLEQEARDEAEEGSDTEVEIRPAPKPKKKKKVAEKAAPSVEVQPPRAKERSYMIPPGAKADPNGYVPLRSTMRTEPASKTTEPHIRKSMRGEGSMRSSLRGTPETSEPKGSLQKKYRPISAPSGEIKPDPVQVKKHIRALSAANASISQAAPQTEMSYLAPTVRRKGSGDSESSFKRSKASNDVPSFRRSMRGPNEKEPARRHQSPMRSGRFSLRSMSPTGSSSNHPFNSGATALVPLSPTHMRSSMRNSYDSAPSLRNSNSSKIPSFGFSGSSRPKKQKSPARHGTSRFADSSDEEDDLPTFHSRFNDSSDEDVPASTSNTKTRTMRSSAGAPVRGIPKRTGAEDGDSSDLPDSDDEKPLSPGLKLKKRGTNGTAATSTTQGTILASGSLRRSGSGRGTISSPITATTITSPPTRSTHNRGGSIMSILRRKKPDFNSKVRKSDAESPARRDTPLERSKSDLAALKNEGPSTPRLQKRNPLSRETSGTWPLPVTNSPPKIVGGEYGRPFTADGGDGVAGSSALERPDLGTRRFTAAGLPAVDGTPNGVEEGKRKKKKFGTLRRMFRLDD